MKRSLNLALVTALVALGTGVSFPSQGPPPHPVLEVASEQTHWITIASGIRHNKTCRWYKNSKGRPCGPKEGRACKNCGG